MSLPTKSAAYTDCQTLYLAALSTPGGVRNPFPTENAAKLFQLRMHQCRSLLQSESRRAYPPDSPAYDTSEFDGLQVQVRGPDGNNEWWIYVRPHGVELNWEPIEPDMALTLPTHTDTLLIEHQENDLA